MTVEGEEKRKAERGERRRRKEKQPGRRAVRVKEVDCGGEKTDGRQEITEKKVHHGEKGT